MNRTIKVILILTSICLVVLIMYLVIKKYRDSKPKTKKEEAAEVKKTQEEIKKNSGNLDIVKLGSKGDAVKSIQILLNSTGKIEPKLVIDGDFGKKSEAALILVTGKNSIALKDANILIKPSQEVQKEISNGVEQEKIVFGLENNPSSFAPDDSDVGIGSTGFWVYLFQKTYNQMLKVKSMTQRLASDMKPVEVNGIWGDFKSNQKQRSSMLRALRDVGFLEGGFLWANGLDTDIDIASIEKLARKYGTWEQSFIIK